MLTQQVLTMTYEQENQRIRDRVTTWRLFGIIPIFRQRIEVWRRPIPISDEDRLSTFIADNWQCVYCGSADRTLLAIDHRLPQTQGGTSGLDNLLTACKRCNSIKNGKTPEEANMTLAWGRFATVFGQPTQPPRSNDFNVTGFGAKCALSSHIDPTKAAHVANLIEQQQGKMAIIKEVWGVTSGRAYQTASREYEFIIARYNADDPNAENDERPGMDIPEEERAQIIALANEGLSRGKIADRVYGGRGKYDRVKLVLDEAGL